MENKLNNTRQIPSASNITREKDYCDLLYAWLQCNSEPCAILEKGQMTPRRILKKKVKWLAIEKDFTRKLSDKTVEKVMSRKTIAKYFEHLLKIGLVEDRDKDDEFYYLVLLDRTQANLIEYHTLMKLMNVLQKNSLSIYVYLFNRYYAAGQNPYIITIKQIKDFIGIATTTTSNNAVIDDSLDILKRLGLLNIQIKHIDNKTCFEVQWVKNKLP